MDCRYIVEVVHSYFIAVTPHHPLKNSFVLNLPFLDHTLTKILLGLPDITECYFSCFVLFLLQSLPVLPTLPAIFRYWLLIISFIIVVRHCTYS